MRITKAHASCKYSAQEMDLWFISWPILVYSGSDNPVATEDKPGSRQGTREQLYIEITRKLTPKN